MSDQPWNRQPAKPIEPSVIVPPTDTIQITIDNYAKPAPRASMLFSRALPVPYVVHLLAGLIKDLIEQGAAQQSIAMPSTIPPTTPPAPGNGNP